MVTNSDREIGLVSCVKTKRESAAIPKELYTSPYFRKMRSYAEREHDEWWILSAEHGLLDPDGEPIEPYEKTLSNASVSERREWAETVIEQMRSEGLFDKPVRFVVHAGKAYYGELVPRLGSQGEITVEIPTEGLAIGEKLAWYNEENG